MQYCNLKISNINCYLVKNAKNAQFDGLCKVHFSNVLTTNLKTPVLPANNTFQIDFVHS